MVKYINRSQTPECGNCDRDPDIPFLGIFVSKIRYFVFAVYKITYHLFLWNSILFRMLLVAVSVPDRVGIFSCPESREYWMIYRGPGFIDFVYFGSLPTPCPLSRKQVISLSQSFCVPPIELTNGRGGGAKSCDGEKACSSFVYNHSTLSAWIYRETMHREKFRGLALRPQCCSKRPS